MQITLSICLAAGALQGVCMADIKMNEDWTIDFPSWATLKWQDYAAHIVASEARGVDSADIVIACTLINDIEKGYNPWNLYPGRWHGYGAPDDKDRQAVKDALFRDACLRIPVYKYVGNFRDAQYWNAVNMIDDGPFDLYIGTNGRAVVGVE